MAISKKEKQMYYSIGHKAKITLKDGEIYECECIGYTSSIDNEPDPADIDIKLEGLKGVINITEPEIKEIVTMD